jgi:spore coat protein H
MSHWWREHPRIRRTQILLLTLLSVGLISVLALAPDLTSAPQVPLSESLLAYAYVMPDDGWAPLTVYLSPFGSRDLDGQIVRYEWDLDGDGSFETDATATAGYTQTLYTRPRSYTASLRVTNAKGEQSIASTAVTVRHPASSSVDYESIFDVTEVRQITMLFNTADWERMMEDPTLKIRVEADAEIFGERLERVEIGPRGNFTLRIAGKKIPWQLDTDNLVPGQEYHNLKQLLLTNNIGDPPIMGEKIAYDLLEIAGAPASHVNFVELYIDLIDDEADPLYWGVYTLVERVDSKYIRNRFGTEADGGSLYKTNHYKQGAGDLVYYGPTLEYYPQPHEIPLYDLRTDDAPGDYADLIQFLWVLDGQAYESPDAWADAVESIFGMDDFLRWLAVQSAIMSWDIYPYTGNNYYLYHNPTADIWLWLPWDQTWGDQTQTPLFSISNESPRLLERAPLYDQMLQVPRYRQALAAYLDLLVRIAFNEASMTERVQIYRDLIAPSLRKGDPVYTLEGSKQSMDIFYGACDRLIELTRARSQFIRETLQEKPEIYLWTPAYGQP